MIDHDAAERLSSAQATIGRALGLWDGTSMETIESCNRLLEASAASLVEFRSAIAHDDPIAAEQFRAGILRIQKQLGHLTKIVDSSAAFVRGVAVYSGATWSTYDASGRSDLVDFRKS